MHLGLLYDSCDIDSVEGCNQELISRCFGDFGGSANGGGAAMDPYEQRARGLIRGLALSLHGRNPSLV